LRGREYIPKMKHPDNQWFGNQCKNKKYMKLICILAMDILQGNYLSIDYVRNTLIYYRIVILNLLVKIKNNTFLFLNKYLIS